MNRKPDRIDEDDTQFWFDEDDKIHNENGYSAKIYSCGSKVWYKHGLRHNDFGPAIIWNDGSKYWFIDGIKYSEKEFLQFKIKNFINE